MELPLDARGIETRVQFRFVQPVRVWQVWRLLSQESQMESQITAGLRRDFRGFGQRGLGRSTRRERHALAAQPAHVVLKVCRRG